MTTSFHPLGVSDVRYRIRDNDAGVGETLRVARDNQKHQVSLMIPQTALDLAPGTGRVLVQLRAFVGERLIGGTHPTTVDLYRGR